MLVSSQLDQSSGPPFPSEGLAVSRSCRSRTCQPGFVDPALESRETTQRVPHAGVEPTNRPSVGQRLKPQDRASITVRVFGGSRTRRLDLHRVACSPVTPQTPSLPNHLQWTRRESNPHYQHARLASSRWTTGPFTDSGREGSRTLIGRVQTDRLPVRRHAQFFRQRTSGPAGSRTPNLDFKKVLLCQLSYKANVLIEQVPRQGIEPCVTCLKGSRFTVVASEAECASLVRL